MKSLLSSVLSLCIISSSFAQLSIDIQAKGSANSTWLINKNITDLGERQDYAAGWGSSYGIAGNIYAGIIGVGIEIHYATHNAAYEGVISEFNTVLDTYNSEVNLETIQIPLLLKFQSERGSYIEIGPQLTNISSATYNRSGTAALVGEYTLEPKDVSEQYSESYLSGVLGFGAKIPLGEGFPLGVLIGIRLQYSFGDLMGVDGEGLALGSEGEPSFFHPTHQPTQAISGGGIIGLTWTVQ